MMLTNLNLKDCRGSPPPADSLSLPMPDWPAEINKIQYWPIRLSEEKQSQQMEANPNIFSDLGL